MPDEYYQRYNRYSHDQLYRQLLQGSPAVLARQADAWCRAGEAVSTVSAKLRGDLNRLATRWTGLGSEEFESRIGLIVNYAQDLADEAASIGVGTEAMSRALAEAQRQAEPNPTAPTVAGSDPAAIRAALRTAASDWTPEAVLDSALGHTPTVEEQSAAFERMVTLVAELATLYGVVDQAKWPATIPDAPAGMPGDAPIVVDQTPEPTGGLAGAGVSGPTMLGPTGQIPAGLGVGIGSIPGGPIGAPVPAAMLAGAAPGLAGAAKTSVSPVAATATAAGAPAAAAAAGMPMMMGHGGVIGQQPGGSVDVGVQEGADWWAGPGAAWVTAGGDGPEPPDAVVDASA